MSLLDRSRVEPRLGEYGLAQAQGSLSDPTLWPRVQEYKRLLGSRMTAISRDELRQRLPGGDLHVSRKYDGEFTVLVLAGDEAFTVNPGGTVRVGLPAVAEAQALAARAGVTHALIAGELYLARPGARTRVHDATQALGRPRDRAELESLRFAAFDLLEPRGASFADIWKRLEELLGGGTLAHPVEGFFTRRVEDAEARFRAWVEEEGWEGIVVRSDAAGLFKVKNRFTLDVVVVGYAEGLDDRKGMLHDLLTAVVRPDGAYHILTRVGGGFTEDERRSILAELRALAVPSDYTEVSPDHLAYQMVRPEWVIEISCIDLMAQTTRGGPIERMVLAFGDDRYEIVRRLPLAAVIAPNHLRRRLDKQPSPEETGLRQVAELVEIPLAERDARDLTLPKSELLRREVYTKVLRGATMVRKLLLWKTHKERDSDDYPAFVLYVTDFSPNRRQPLERELRIGASLEEMERMWEAVKKERILGGWIRVADK